MEARKILSKLLLLTVVVVGLVSCSKDDAICRGAWSGEATVRMLNNDTGEWTEHTSAVELEFTHNGMECKLTKGIAGLFAVTVSVYQVEWETKNQKFTIFDRRVMDDGDVWDGEINGDIMNLFCRMSEVNYTLKKK